MPPRPLTTEQRVDKMARASARLICKLRRDGDLSSARKLEAAAIETAEAIRAGRV